MSEALLAASPSTFAWNEVGRALDQHGWSVLPGLLGDRACDALAVSYDEEGAFRIRAIMAKHGFGLPASGSLR